MSLKSKILPFVPYGIVMKYHHRNLELTGTIEREIGKGHKFTGSINEKQLIISVHGTGYSGSSAVVDLLREYDSNFVFGFTEARDVPAKSHKELAKIMNMEFDLLRMPSGIWEMERVLTSDKWSIGWKIIGEFREYVEEWIKSLNGHTVFSGKEFQYIVAEFIDSVRLPFSTNNGSVIYPRSITTREFQKAAKRFLISTFSLFNTTKNLVFDQLLNDGKYDSDEYDQYLSRYKIIHVNRDPRDIYMTSVSKCLSWIPTLSAEDFIIWYGDRIKNLYKAARNSDKFLILRLEDLVNDYALSVGKIERFIGLHPSEHKRMMDFFDPKVSFRNVGLWKSAEGRHKDAVEKIAQAFPEYSYNR